MVNKNTKICVIGTGYVGLVTGVCLANSGHEVICVDKDLSKIDLLNKGNPPIFESGLKALLRKNLNDKRLIFKTELDEEAISSNIIFIAVGTPSESNGRPNLKYIYEVAHEIGNKMNHHKKSGHKIIVIKSTIPPGTTCRIKNIILTHLGKRGGSTFDLVFNPEFLREGSAIKDTLFPDRIVIGVENNKPVKILKKVFKSAVKILNPNFLITDIPSAEMIKYSSNAFLATKISFINEISHLCELIGANINDVAAGVGMDRRIGSSFLKAGLGYGGSCFPKDTHGLDHLACDHGHMFHLLKAVIDVNNIQKKRFINKIIRVLNGVENKTLGVLGLAFKPNTDDIRESVAIDLIKILIEKGAKIKTHDPLAEDNAKLLFSEDNVCFYKNPYDVAKGSHALIIATEWKDFSRLNLRTVRSNLKKPIIFDGRNLLNPEEARKAGIQYHAIGGHERSGKNG